jgi:hypothetical protein
MGFWKPKWYTEEELIEKWIIPREKKSKINISKLFWDIWKKNLNKKYEKYSEKLLKEWFSEETENLIFEWSLKKLKNKSVVIEGKKIIFDEIFLYLHKDKMIKNLENFLIYLMNIESFWWKNVENKNSSAKWPLQWIDWWKNLVKHNNYNRKKWDYSPFETALRRADLFYSWNKYPSFQSEKTPKYIKEAWNNGWKLIQDKFNIERQIQLWFIDILMRWWKATKYIMWTMHWNTESAEKLYLEIHHTKTKSIKTTEEVSKKHTIYLTQI